MTEFAGIFEVLASDQHDARLASRKALVLSRDRLDARLGKFLLASRSGTEFAARYDLVADDFAGIVRVAAQEVGHDNPDSLIETLRDHYRSAAEQWIQDAVKKPGDLHKKLHIPEDEKIPESKIEEAEESGSKDLKEKAQFAENVKGLGKGKKSKKNKKKDKDSKPPWLQDKDGDDELEFSAKTADDKGNTGLSGPSPKMKKQRWTPKSVSHDEYDGGKNEVGDHEEKDVLDNEPPKNLTSPAKDAPETGKAKEEKLPSASNYDDSGFAGNNQEMAPHTKTFGDGDQTKPVTQEALSSVHTADIPPGHELCPRCKGQGCNDCKGRGVLPVAAQPSVPENMRTEWLPEHTHPSSPAPESYIFGV